MNLEDLTSIARIVTADMLKDWKAKGKMGGPQGEPGEDGKDGKDGKPGLNGKDGKDGRDGKDGKAGPKGERGESLKAPTSIEITVLSRDEQGAIKKVMVSPK